MAPATPYAPDAAEATASANEIPLISVDLKGLEMLGHVQGVFEEFARFIQWSFDERARGQSFREVCGFWT